MGRSQRSRWSSEPNWKITGAPMVWPMPWGGATVPPAASSSRTTAAASADRPFPYEPWGHVG
jgi:hypothetical protein